MLSSRGTDWGFLAVPLPPPRCAILLAAAENLDREDRQHGHPADPPRLVDEPVQPLETGPPHPQRCTRHATGEVVVCPADADCHGNTDAVLHPVYPQLLLRSAERDEQDLRLMSANQLQRLVVG